MVYVHTEFQLTDVAWKGVVEVTRPDARLRVTSRHMQTRNPRKLKLVEHVDTDLGYLHTKFHLPRAMRLGIA